jgi:hypothetical protein
MSGPVTWYSVTYQCGPSDGKMPTFTFRGGPTVNANINVHQQSPITQRQTPARA